MKWEFDAALHDRISNRIECSIDNESRVLALWEVHQCDQLFKIFRVWRDLVVKKRSLPERLCRLLEERREGLVLKGFHGLKEHQRRK